MRVVEILLPKGMDRSLSPATMLRIDFLQQRMNSFVDKILDPHTSAAGREFLKSKLSDDYFALKGLMQEASKLSEAVHKLPLTQEDFELVKKLMENPIPATIAPIYIQEIINDDELNDQIRSLEETSPGRDVRPLIAEWFERVMPDQMYRFRGDHMVNRQGLMSPIHGYDPHMYKGENDPITGNAYGRW
jgi:hypothetical protein